MFHSTYIPVQQDGHDGIYHATKYFDGGRLKLAVQLLKNPGSEVEGVKISAGNVYFTDDKTLAWPVFEVFMAHNALKIAEESDFWFTPIKSKDDVIQLFISKQFHERCILVNALTMHSLLLKNKAHIQTLQNLKSGVRSYVYLQRLFIMLEGVDVGTMSILSAIRATTPDGEQYMVTNPYTYPFHDEIDSYSVEILEEFRQILKDKVRRTESFESSHGNIIRIDGAPFPVIPKDIASTLVKTYDTIVENKSNYIAVYNPDMEDYLYWSTNKRYLVRADTLECVIVKNDFVKKLLSTVADGGVNDPSHLDLIWRLACQM